MHGMRGKATLAVAGVALAVLAVAGGLLLAGKGSRLTAANQADIGYVDIVRLSEEYLRPQLDRPLAEETRRLQAEFDAEAQDLDDGAKTALFNEYQARLNVIKQDMIDQHLPAINEAIAAVAQEAGVKLVIEKQTVLYGGLDLTDAVLAKLGAAQ